MRQVSPVESLSVALVITTYNHAHFLPDALDSAMAQTMLPAEIIVVDDGSSDDPASVVARYPSATLLRTANQGLAAARNVGLEAARSRFIVFLDADDVLLENALADGVACHLANPGAAMVCGGFRFANAALEPQGDEVFPRLGPLSRHALLRGNQIGMHATVLYDAALLRAAGGFDPGLRRCEDYELYLRLSRTQRIACHRGIVALYRMHGANMSLDAVEMLGWNRKVLERHKPDAAEVEARRAWNEGMRSQLGAFANIVWAKQRAPSNSRWRQRRRMMSQAPLTTSMAALRQLAVRCLPRSLAARLRAIRHRALLADTGRIDFGDLARVRPVSQGYGFSRGTPVDRFYIERFLQRHAAEIRGRALEVADPKYCRRFGTGVTQQDVLNAAPSPEATLVGDLGTPGVLPDNAFDCMVITQTLQYVFDLRSALAQIHRALKPGGTILATVPAISPVDHADWQWYWLFTGHSVRKLFEDAFGTGNVDIDICGNAFAATCFVQGIAQEDIGAAWLEPNDPMFPVCITVKATKAAR